MRLRHGLAVLLVLANAACNTETTVFKVECSFPLTVFGGNFQTAPVNSTLPAKLSVGVSGDSMLCWGPTDVVIQWTVESGGGSVVRDASDQGTAEWTLGPSVGPQNVRATWTNPTGKASITTVLFSANALPQVQ